MAEIRARVRVTIQVIPADTGSSDTGTHASSSEGGAASVDGGGNP